MGLEWNWRESSPCNLLIARRLSVDYTLLRFSISEKRPSSCATRARHCDASRAARVMQFLLELCAHFGSVFRQLREIVRARVPKGRAAIRTGCAHCSGSVGQWMYPAVVRAERHCVVRASTSVGGHGDCQLPFLARWLLLNRVQRPVQDEWQGETRLRFKLRGLCAPPCARCCARTRVRCAPLSIPAATRMRN